MNAKHHALSIFWQKPSIKQIARVQTQDHNQQMSVERALVEFLNTGQIPKMDSAYYCETRDQANSRLSSWIQDFQKIGMSENSSIILGSILGELSNNSFDHNLGKWNSVPGCLVAFENQKKDDQTKNNLLIFIADRGQGIISSLKNSLPTETNPKVILQKAFEERISGRAPEKRGNGLKYVMKSIIDRKNSLLCISQGEKYFYQDETLIDQKNLKSKIGTIIAIKWGIYDT